MNEKVDDLIPKLINPVITAKAHDRLHPDTILALLRSSGDEDGLCRLPILPEEVPPLNSNGRGEMWVKSDSNGTEYWIVEDIVNEVTTIMLPEERPQPLEIRSPRVCIF